MPRLRRKAERFRYDGPTTFAVKSGCSILSAPDARDDDGLETLRQAWHALRDELLEASLDETGWPRRPWAWWRFDKELADPLAAFAVAPPWSQARELHRLDELTRAERSRLPALVREKALKLAARSSMEPQQKLKDLRDFAAEVGVELAEAAP